ncbi:MAG: class I SAM-dependent methyltransferase [Bdellovibrionales bacterium]|nr:class I SAM-dependent methyltransferase [Bdellovibrionales bacterium]
MNWQNCIEHSIKFKTPPPESFFYKLKAHDVGFEGQSILLLTANNGKLAFEFAKRGLQVTAVDQSSDFIEEAKQQAAKQNLKIDFRHCPAEDIPLEAHNYDVILIHQGLKYLNIPKILVEARRLLTPGGFLVTSHIRWLPRLDIIAKKSEDIILKYNSKWENFDFTGEIYPMPKWAEQALQLRAMFFYDENLEYTQENWIGRLKASGSLSGSLSRSKLLDFEKDLKDVISEIKDGDLEIRHRIDAHIFQFK